MDIIKDGEKIADRLTWHTANRDQAGIALDLADGKDIPFYIPAKSNMNVYEDALSLVDTGDP